MLCCVVVAAESSGPLHDFHRSIDRSVLILAAGRWYLLQFTSVDMRTIRVGYRYLSYLFVGTMTLTLLPTTTLLYCTAAMHTNGSKQTLDSSHDSAHNTRHSGQLTPHRTAHEHTAIKETASIDRHRH